MTSQTRTTLPKRAVYRKRHKALQHLTDDNTHHGFGQRVVAERDSNEAVYFGVSGPSGVQTFQSVNSGNYREAATKKEPKYRQMPNRHTGSQITIRRSRQRGSRYNSPPLHMQPQGDGGLQSRGSQDPSYSCSIPISVPEHNNQQYAQSRYSMFGPYPADHIAGHSPSAWNQSYSPTSSDHSMLSDAPYQDTEPQRFACPPMTYYSCSNLDPAPNTIGGSGPNSVETLNLQCFIDNQAYSADVQADVSKGLDLHWDACLPSYTEAPAFNPFDSAIWNETGWGAMQNSHYPLTYSAHDSRDSHFFDYTACSNSELSSYK